MIAFVARIFYRMASGNPKVPVTLGLRDIYILCTGYGLLYLTGLTAMLIGSINYSNNLGFLLTFLLASLGLTAMLHTYAALYGLRLTAALAAPVFAGEVMHVEITVAGGERPRTALRWFFDPHRPVAVNILPDGRTPVRVPVVAGDRGWFSPPRLSIVCDYPLGLFRAWARIHTDIREVVYPQPVAGPTPITDLPADQGEKGGFRVAGTDDFLGRDAVDDFLFVSRHGFCEHFASAFTVLMRSAGVPTRMVGGYQGGRWNEWGNLLTVRQADAHVWCDVWLEKRGWIRMDPTFEVAPDRIEDGIDGLFEDLPWLSPIHGIVLLSQWIEKVRQTWEVVNIRWNIWFMGFSAEDQAVLLKNLFNGKGGCCWSGCPCCWSLGGWLQDV